MAGRHVGALVGLDFLVGIAAIVCASLIRFEGEVPAALTLLGVLLAVAWVSAVSLGNGYERRIAGQAGAEEYRAVGRGLLYVFSGLSIVSYAGDLRLSRGYLAVALGLLAVGALTSRKVLRTRLARRREGGQCLAATLVIGRADSVTALVTSIEQDMSLGLRPVAACASDLAGRGLPAGRELAGVPVVGSPWTRSRRSTRSASRPSPWPRIPTSPVARCGASPGRWRSAASTSL